MSRAIVLDRLGFFLSSSSVVLVVRESFVFDYLLREACLFELVMF